ncbi:dUTP diphosphatase [Desulfurobacterium atlanticum]|uniref:dUTP diphosphatase n=1 Tax=Desulfurobacterium atlanticum TaxID=240169 RepID=A0A238ZU83_9BACT|nr:dUTP pyrophosphatase [Desulfurobacterium atlanticum]SNR86213.1 dUTP pyrophosphatase [Desulfurobacterium atlanticum]
MNGFNWAAGWVYGKGLNIVFDERFLDVAVKIHSILGGNLKREGEEFIYSLYSFPEGFSVDIEFVKGIFEASGVWGNKTVFIPSVPRFSKKIAEILSPFSPYEAGEGFFLKGDGAVLFLHAIYDESKGERSEYHFEKFLSFLYGGDWKRKFIEVSVEEGGIPPFKKRISDSGWDLYLVEVVKQSGDVYLFDTKVKVKPPAGYYLDLVPRSSIYKSGFILANSVGIIDMTYRGTIKVPLVRIDHSKEFPELPWRAVQLIPRRFYPLEVKKVSSLDETLRGERGFGSTGK